MGSIVVRKDGTRRDVREGIELFFFKKFGYKWKKKMRDGSISKEELDSVQEEFEQFISEAKR